jgi:succinoglycan biosynthesis transport protein ExoP
MDKENIPNQSLVHSQNVSRFPVPYSPSPEPTIYMYEPDMEDRINLLDYWRVIVKRRWIILALVCVVLAVTAIATWKATPVYRATIQLQIDPEQSNLLPFSDMGDMGRGYAQSLEYLQTQFKVMESRNLAERVIRALHLESNPSFTGEETGAKSRTVQWFRSLWSNSDENENLSPEEILNRKMDRLVRMFHDSLETSPIRNTRLVNATFDSPDPALAADVVNELANQYILLNFETKANSIKDASEFLQNQVAELKFKVEQAEEDLVTFGRVHDIYEISDKENVILQTLSDLNTALTAARAERIQEESAWKTVRQAEPGVFPSSLRSGIIDDLEKKIADLKVQQAKLSASFRPGWPALDQVTGQIAQAESQLEAARAGALKNVETEYRTALEKEQMLNDALSKQKAQASSFSQNSIQYNILKREADTQKQLYEGLLQRMNEAGVSESLKSSNIHIIDKASPPVHPSRPDKKKNMALALAVGLLLALGLAFFVERLDSSVKTPDDVERYIHLPSLGLIPSAASLLPSTRRRKLPSALGKSGAPGENSETSIEMITHRNSKSVVSEAYRNLRTSILLSSGKEHPPKLFLVTSSQPMEGKTTTAINLAITLSQTGERVVLLDCDMRNPNVHRAFGASSREGMSTFLSGQSDLSSLVQSSEIPNLYTVSAGIIPPNPAELLSSERMREGLKLLKENFDYIIIDSPPVLSVTDARIIGSMVEGVILVVKGGETPREAVIRTKQLLQEVHANIIGMLLNNVDIRSADFNLTKYQYYGYGYGYGKKNADHREGMNS